MKHETLKRIKLLLALISIIGSTAVLIVFFHTFIFDSYLKAKKEVIPDMYRTEVYKLILEIEKMPNDDIKEKVRGGLWNLCSGTKLNKDKVDKDTITSTRELSDYVRMTYIIIAFFVMIVSVVFTKWYTSGLDTFIEYTKK